MAGKSLPGFSQLPVITELFFLCGGIKPLPLLEMKMRDFRVFLGSWAERVFCWSRQRRWRGLDGEMGTSLPLASKLLFICGKPLSSQ